MIPYNHIRKYGQSSESKKYPETGIRKIYGRKSVRITNSLLVFPDTSCLGQVAHLIRFLSSSSNESFTANQAEEKRRNLKRGNTKEEKNRINRYLELDAAPQRPSAGHM